MRGWKRLRCLLLLVLLSGAALDHPAHAQQQPPLQIQVLPIFQGHYLTGNATLLRIQLENQGPDLDGELQIDALSSVNQQITVVPLSMPRNSRKEVRVVISPQAFGWVEVRFVAGRETVTAQRVSLTLLPSGSTVIGLLVDDPTPLSFLSGIRTPCTLLTVSPSDIVEEFWPLRNLHALVIAGVDTSSLSAGQQQALIDWVATGGHLVVGGGPLASLATAGLPADLLPVSFEGEATLETLPALEELADEPIPPAGPYPLSRLSLRTGTVLAAEGDLPLIATRSYGLGRVSVLALDPTLAPLRSWAGNLALWRQLLVRDSFAELAYHQQMGDAWSITSYLAQAAGVRMPSMAGVGGLLLFYILLVGPASYMVLKRRRRLEWAWVTIPVLTILFAAGVYFLGQAIRGGNRSLTTLSVVRLASGGPVGLVDTYAGLFSPRRQEYTISAAPPARFDTLGEGGSPYYGPMTPEGVPLTIHQEEQPTLAGFRVEQWSQRIFAVRTTAPAPAIQAEIVEGPTSQITGTFSNRTDLELSDCFVASGGRYGSLGRLGPGESRTERLSLSPSFYSSYSASYSYGGPGSPRSPSATHPYDILYALLDPSGYGTGGTPLDMILVCWSEGSPTDLDLHGQQARRQGTTIYLVAMEGEGAGQPLKPTPMPSPVPPSPPTPAPTSSALDLGQRPSGRQGGGW